MILNLTRKALGGSEDLHQTGHLPHNITDSSTIVMYRPLGFHLWMIIVQSPSGIWKEHHRHLAIFFFFHGHYQHFLKLS